MKQITCVCIQRKKNKNIKKFGSFIDTEKPVRSFNNKLFHVIRSTTNKNYCRCDTQVYTYAIIV